MAVLIVLTRWGETAKARPGNSLAASRSGALAAWPTVPVAVMAGASSSVIRPMSSNSLETAERALRS